MKLKDKVRQFFGKLAGSFDPGSLKLRLWGNFGLFAVILVLILWILQVVFLSYYYEGMKLRETERIVADIESQFRKDQPLSDIRAYATQIYWDSGIYIQIEPEQGFPIVIPFVNFDAGSEATDASGNAIEELPAERPGSFYPTVYRNEIDNLKSQLLDSGERYFSKQTIEPETERKTLEYAVFLETHSDDNLLAPGEIDLPVILPDALSDTQQDAPENNIAQYYDRLILFVFSPLYPQESTSQILTDQLIYVTIIAVLLSILIGFYLSRMITRPLEEITKNAEDLAAGNFDVDFQTTPPYSEIAEEV